ncbi:unnamed protein product [Anisakis simplex]|uniref:Selenocysteine lyase n=1 Tax=Anisakis simplex TaxID=6269 RepID=A0A0M3JTY8_ANISI|nr:unnamed protein product [Anisakis simplex]
MAWYIEEQECTYLDYNATTPLDKFVEDTIVNSIKFWANPSSNNSLGRKAKEVIEAARERVASLLNVSAKEVFFTSGGTESNHWVIYNAVEHFKESHDHELKPHVVTSSIEHPSILELLRSLQTKGEIEYTAVGVSAETGIVELNEVEDALCERTVLVSVMLANNETGVIQPVAKIADIARQASERFNSRILVHTDAAQAIGKIEVDMKVLKTDFITVVGHKVYGPRIGALVIRNEKTVPLQALFRGGFQENGKRAGTENTAMIAGLGAACQIASERLSANMRQMRHVRDYFEEQLRSILGDAVRIHFTKSERIPNTSSVSFIKYPGNAVDFLSKCKSFTASTGAACHAGTNGSSTVLLACGLSEEVACRTVRFSFGRESSEEQVDRVINEIKSVCFFGKYGSSLLKAINKGPVSGF